MLPAKDMKILGAFYEATEWGRGGEVVLRHGTETGRVFFAKGKMAWVTVSTIKKTFTTFLIEQSSVAEGDIREVFEDCKRTGKNFGETIVEWGLLEEGALREYLLQHFVDCLIELLSWPSIDSMFMPEEKDYKGSLTFDFSEMLEAMSKKDGIGRLSFSRMPVQEILAEIEKNLNQKEQPVDSLDAAGAPTMTLGGRGRGKVIALVAAAIVLLVGGSLVLLLKDNSGEGKSSLPEPVPILAPQSGMTGVIKVGSTPPGAQVFLDDVLQPGLTPTKLDSIRPGQERVVRLSLAGWAPWQEKVRLSDVTKPLEIAALLVEEQKPKEPEKPVPPGTSVEPAKVPEPAAPETPARIVAGLQGEGAGIIRVFSVPKNARIYLDGIDTGRQTPFILRDVPGGLEHVVFLERKGFEPAFQRLKIEKSGDGRVNLRLKKGKPQSGEVLVRVESDPKGAGVFINGRPAEKGTPLDVKLPAGRPSKLELRRRGFQNWIRNVYPVPSVDLTFSAKLKKK